MYLKSGICCVSVLLYFFFTICIVFNSLCWWSLSLLGIQTEPSPHDLLKPAIPGIPAMTDSDFGIDE